MKDLLHAVAQLVHLMVQSLVVFDQRTVLVFAIEQRLVEQLDFALVLLVLQFCLCLNTHTLGKQFTYLERVHKRYVTRVDILLVECS